MNQLNQSNSNNFKQKIVIFWEARTRILAWYLSLITIFLLSSIPLMNRLISIAVNNRARQELQEELEAFNDFTQENNKNNLDINNNQLKQLFDEFLALKIPEDETFLITIINQQFYRSSPASKPRILAEKSPLMAYWQQLQQAREGEWMNNEPNIETIVYLTQPVIIDGEVKGIFVAAHVTAGEIKEAMEVLKISLSIWVVVLFLAALAAWIASGKVLNPLQKLTETVLSINQLDLKQRIEVTGTGEIAELTKGFNQMMERLEKVFFSQRELLNDAGHELRTPITIIRGNLEIMGNNPVEQEETLAIVFDELDRMSRLVNNLIFLAKAERPDFLQQETIDIASFSQEIYRKITALAQRNWQLNEQGKGKFRGDRQRLTQALINLAQNAVQHTQETDKIILTSKTDHNYVYFTIEDTGKGFAPEDEEMIFQRFARASNNERHYEGQGLGLSIVQAIVEAHQGKVTARGELNKGATFTLILPFNTARSKNL